MFVPVDVPLYLCAGFMYGFVRGSLLCWIGYNVGSWVGFYFGRWCFRDWLIETTKDQLHIQAIRAAVDDNSLVLVLLLQIAPIMPYSMVCYFLRGQQLPFLPELCDRHGDRCHSLRLFLRLHRTYACFFFFLFLLLLCCCCTVIVPVVCFTLVLVWKLLTSRGSPLLPFFGSIYTTHHEHHHHHHHHHHHQGSTMKSVAEATSGKAENSDQYWYFIYISSLVGLLTLVFISLEAKKQLDRLIGTSDANAVANRDAEAARPQDTATRTNASGARGLTTPHPTGRA